MPVNHHLAPLLTHNAYGSDYFFTDETIIDADNSLFISGGGDLITMHPPPSSHDHKHTHNDAHDDLIWEGANIFDNDGDSVDGIGGTLLVHPVPTYLTNARVNGRWEGGAVDDDSAAGFDAVLNNVDNSSSHLPLPGLLPIKQELLLPGIIDSGGDDVFDNNNNDNYNISKKGSRKYMAGSDDDITVRATNTTTDNNNNIVANQQQEGLTLERVSMKLFNAHPDDLPPEIQNELRQLLNATTGTSSAFALSIRPGCVQITMDALLTEREKDVMKAKGVAELAQVALNHALSAVPALSSPAAPAAASSAVTPRLEGDDEVNVSISTSFDNDRSNNVPLINGKHPDLMFCYGNEMAYVNRDDGVISTSTTTTGTGLPPPSSSPTNTTIIPHAPLLEAVQPLAMTPEAAAITNLVLYGKNITGTHDAVFIRSRGRSVNLSVMAVVPPNYDNDSNGNGGSGSQQSDAYVSDRERVVVEILEPAQGLHRVEVQRGAVLSQSVSFLVLDDAEAVREIQQLETCSTVTPSQVQAFVSDVGVVMDFIARRGVWRCVTEEEKRRVVVLARRLLVLSVNRGWKAMVRMLMPLALLPVGIPISPNATVTTAIDSVMAELDGCARALGAVPLLRSSFSSSKSESLFLPNGEGSGRHQARYFEEALRKAVSTSFLHVVAASPCPEIAKLLETWACRISYPWTIKTTTMPDDVEGKGQEQQQQLGLTPLHLTCLLNDQAAMAAALTTMIDASTGGDDNNSHGGYKLWFKLKDGKRRTAAQFAKVVGNDRVLQWLNKERDCRGLSISDIEKEIAEEEMMMKNKNKKSSREGSQEQMGVGTAAAAGGDPSSKQVSALNIDEEEEEDMLVAAGSQKKPAVPPPPPPPPPFTFWKNKCSKERTADIVNDVRTAQIIEDAHAAAHGEGATAAAAARRRRGHNENDVPVVQQVAVLGIIAFATMALKILSSS